MNKKFIYIVDKILNNNEIYITYIIKLFPNLFFINYLYYYILV